MLENDPQELHKNHARTGYKVVLQSNADDGLAKAGDAVWVRWGSNDRLLLYFNERSGDRGGTAWPEWELHAMPEATFEAFVAAYGLWAGLVPWPTDANLGDASVKLAYKLHLPRYGDVWVRSDSSLEKEEVRFFDAHTGLVCSAHLALWSRSVVAAQVSLHFAEAHMLLTAPNRPLP